MPGCDHRLTERSPEIQRPPLDRHQESVNETQAERRRFTYAEMSALGLDIKGLWLVDFDNGSGYYCWKHPEPSLDYYHTYEEGFGGRVRIQ